MSREGEVRELPPEQSLKGRHALVCGASAGIGRAGALALAARGAAVTALARRRDRLEGLLPELRSAGAAKARALEADLDDREGARRLVEALLAEAGSVHVLVNNTGGPPSAPLLDAEEGDFLAALGRHLLAAHMLVKMCLPGMRESGFGRVVNVLSLSVREPIPGLGVSNVTRAAMAAWAKTLSRELPPGVTINNVLPGYTDTERLQELAPVMAGRKGLSAEALREQWIASIPEARLGDPAELGEVIAFLASPAASYVRGVSVPVDGGRLGGV
jgi:3-oxoacyl-[acyl-carrier protein] reductase